MKKQIHEKCAFCNGTEFRTLFSTKGHLVIECKNCHLVRTSQFKLPSYSKYHRDEEYHSTERLFRFIFQKRFSLISNVIHTPGSVLDIGAATGVFLDIFKEHGWETWGVEPSASAEFAREKGHQIENTTLEKSSLKRKFDLIVANHVLEHIENPKTFMQEIKKRLVPGGYVYIDVPNFGSLRSLAMKSHWPYLLVNEHVHHFTPETISALLIDSGFQIEFVKTRSGLFETSNPFSYLLIELLGLKKNFFTDIFSLPVDTVATLLQKGDSVGVLAKITK
ncbi:class I SAM-dependent methyltransferase [Candidatus Woesebacteria bacterium]|nr:class I SAM-dependent methyltransferase [Candidatus Woesebacteria bacterium]